MIGVYWIQVKSHITQNTRMMKASVSTKGFDPEGAQKLQCASLALRVKTRKRIGSDA